MNLFKHQQNLVDLSPDKWLLAWKCGTGKSLAAIELARTKTNNTIIICPKSIKDQWRDYTEFYKIVTKEEFRRDCVKYDKYDCLIIDEGHYFSGIKSAMHKKLMWYIKKHNPDYIYLLTATPYLSTPFNIYCLAKILGKKWGYMTFKQRFFNDIMMGRRMVPVIKKGIEKDIAKLVNSLGDTVRMEDCIDVPEQTFINEYFELTKEQKKGIEDLEDQNHLAYWTKQHQIIGGTLKGDGYVKDQYFASEKTKRLVEFSKEHDKLVVVCRYNNEIKHLESILENTIVINGQTEDRHSAIQTANKMDKCIVLVNAACSEGYELPDFPIMIFYSYDFSLKNYIQICGRIQRINNIKKNVYISYIVKETIDEDVYECIMSKKDFDIAIYDK